MQHLLDTADEGQVFEALLPHYLENRPVIPSDRDALLQYSAVNYDLLGLIGLLTHNLPRIIVGKLCDHRLIRAKCREVQHSLHDLAAVADCYLEEEHTEADEYVYRKIMLRYPRNRVDEKGKLRE